MKKMRILLALFGCTVLSAFAQGPTPKQTEVMKHLLTTYEAQAKEESKGTKAGQFAPFTAEAGREFYTMRRTYQTTDPRCSGCHTEDPTKQGKHIATKEAIKPLAPSANHGRFTHVEKVEKSFSEHCVDLLKRHCSAAEKGNFVAYMMSIK